VARTLKTRGADEVRTLASRTRRQYQLGRISKPDHDFLIERLDEVEARIISMRETNEHGEEEG